MVGAVKNDMKRRSGSYLTEEEEGDVSVRVLSGWHVTSRLDTTIPVPVGAGGLSMPSDCECRSMSYRCWDGDGLYMSGLVPSG